VDEEDGLNDDDDDDNDDDDDANDDDDGVDIPILKKKLN
jgi:hypothetical protein